MSKPLYHAQSSVKKFGGQWQDYIEIHNLIDSSKAAYPKMAHRAIFHHDYGHQLVQKLIKTNKIVNSNGQEILVKDIADYHTQEDLNFLPTLADYSKEYDDKHPLAWKSVGKVDWHCQASVRHYGGRPDDYLMIHQLMLEVSDTPSGRAIYHNSFGTFLVESLLGVAITNSDGKILSVRDIAEQHVLRIFRKIPTLSDWLEAIDRPWMVGTKKVVFQIVD